MYPEEKPSNNPYAKWMQPSDEAPSLQALQQQDQPQVPSSPPPPYSGGPYTQRDATYQGYNPQVQTYQSQSYQTRLEPTAPQYGAEDPSYQQVVPGSRYPHDQHSAGPSYDLHQPINSLSPYSQTPGTGPTSQGRSSSPNDSGLSLATFFGNTGPPPMWQRQPAAHFPYDQFPPMCLISNDKDLGKGFPEVPPPSQVSPHPFATHDIAEEDWKRFLADVKKAGSLSGGQRIKSNVIPLLTGVSLVGGLFLTSAIERKMKAKNRNAAGDVIDHWNYYFFGPRRMEAVLCQGSERLSGRDGPAPLGDPGHLRSRASSRSSSSSSSSSDSGDDRNRHHTSQGSCKSDKRQRRAERKMAKAQRRQEKRARKSERRAGKACGNNRERYQMFIQPI